MRRRQQVAFYSDKASIFRPVTKPEFGERVREGKPDAKHARSAKALIAADHSELAQAVREMVEAVPWGRTSWAVGRGMPVACTGG